MLIETMISTSDGKNLAWKATPGASDLTLANGFANIVYCVAIPVFDCDQVNLLFTPTWGDLTAMKVRVQWSADVTGKRWGWDTFVSISVAAGVNTLSANINEISIDPNVLNGPHQVERMRTNPTQQ